MMINYEYQCESCGLGLNTSEAIKFLDALMRSGKVTAIRRSGKTFYATTEPVDELRA